MKYETLESAHAAGAAPWDLRVEELCMDIAREIGVATGSSDVAV